MLRTLLAAAAVLAIAPAGAARAADEFDGEGFIRTWLLLAPIPLDAGQSGADGVAKEQVKAEAKLRPKEGEKVTAGGKELAWKKYKAADHVVDCNAHLGAQTEDSVGYAVCYVVADADNKDVQLRIGSDDQSKVWLNGKEVLNFTEPRALDKDQNIIEVGLTKGVNVLVIKVVNEKI